MLVESRDWRMGPLAESFADGDRTPRNSTCNLPVRLPDPSSPRFGPGKTAGWPLLGLDEDRQLCIVPRL